MFYRNWTKALEQQQFSHTKSEQTLEVEQREMLKSREPNRCNLKIARRVAKHISRRGIISCFPTIAQERSRKNHRLVREQVTLDTSTTILLKH